MYEQSRDSDINSKNGNVSAAGEFNHQSSYKYTCNPKNQEFVHLMINNKYYLETKDDRAYIYAMHQVDVFRHNKRYTHPRIISNCYNSY